MLVNFKNNFVIRWQCMIKDVCEMLTELDTTPKELGHKNVNKNKKK